MPRYGIRLEVYSCHMRKSSLAVGKKGTLQSVTKVLTLKIKLGKWKQASSEEDGESSAVGSDRDADAEFEQMLRGTVMPSDELQ